MVRQSTPIGRRWACFAAAGGLQDGAPCVGPSGCRRRCARRRGGRVRLVDHRARPGHHRHRLPACRAQCYRRRDCSCIRGQTSRAAAAPSSCRVLRPGRSVDVRLPDGRRHRSRCRDLRATANASRRRSRASGAASSAAGSGRCARSRGSTCDGTGDPPMLIPTIGMPTLEPHCQFTRRRLLPGHVAERRRHPTTDVVTEDLVEVLALPAGHAIEVLVGRLFGEELGRVELTASADDGDVVLLVQHLVIDDPLDEQPRHERPIERRVDADQPILDAVRCPS